eukprot:gene3110-3942_t
MAASKDEFAFQLKIANKLTPLLYLLEVVTVDTSTWDIDMALRKPASVALPPQVRGVSARHARTFAASASDAEPKHYLLTYEYVPDILEKRGPHRPGHLAAAQAQIEAGNLLKGGPLADPVDGAVFLFKCADPTIIDDFVAGDPYVTAGLVPKHQIREWSVLLEAP